MSILLDQCVPRRYLRLLREWGYETSPLAEHVAIDSLDQEVIVVAQSLDAVLLTADKDFANTLDYPPRDSINPHCKPGKIPLEFYDHG